MSAVKDNDKYILRIGKGSRKTFQVELAVSDKNKIRGLSGRNNMPWNNGLLFLYDTMSIQTMWMVDMKFALDIVWLNDWFEIVHITYNTPPCTMKPNCVSYDSKYNVKYAIEMNAGAANHHGFTIGKRLYVICKKN
jgi:uncharacterized membrane protein (UPF0127 family)